LAQCKALERRGFLVTYLPVDEEGLINLSDLSSAITEQTAIVSMMWANNETGVILPVESIGALCHEKRVL
jgi:cysteine desulfurase